jgi:hypothetical protein
MESCRAQQRLATPRSFGDLTLSFGRLLCDLDGPPPLGSPRPPLDEPEHCPSCQVGDQL